MYMCRDYRYYLANFPLIINVKQNHSLPPSFISNIQQLDEGST